MNPSANVLTFLDRNDLAGALTVMLGEIHAATDSRGSWESPQYTTDASVQRALVLDHSRDALFTYFGLATLADRYMLRDADGKLVEGPQQFWARVSTGIALAGMRDEGHEVAGESYFTMSGRAIKKASVVRYAQRLYDIISRHWFCPATPVLTNIGTNRGLPISCYLNTVHDSIDGICATNTENAQISKHGGGIGSDWSRVRHLGARLSNGNQSSGIMPFLKVTDSQMLAVSQGNTRRGAGAVYLHISHPEIEEFVEMRRPTGGDLNRRCLNLNHGVTIDDAFMEAVEARQSYALRCPKTGEVVREVDAFDLFNRLLTMRVETGEPYLLFIDTVKRATPLHHAAKGLHPTQSNLCSEITLPTTDDRTAVCCLGSLNLEHYDQWKDEKDVIYVAVRALDNILQAFCNQAGDALERAKRSAEAERSVGLGVMGYHGYLMSHGLPFESLGARLANKQVFRHIHTRALAASRKLADERGVCPDGVGTEFGQRNSYVMSIAPTASISIITGNATPCVEPITGNAYTQKTMSGSYLVKNRFLQWVLAGYGYDDAATWKSIIGADGSVQHLTFLSDVERAIFRTAWEINQREVVQQAADRQPYICQSQSLNIYFDVDGKGLSRRYLYETHMLAWKAGCKSLYYVRSRSVLKADSVERQAIRHRISTEECAVCQ